MTSADRLREAATQVREVASVNGPRMYPGAWVKEFEDVEGFISWRVTCHDGTGDVVEHIDEELADYFTTMSPPIALAVADLLDDVAADKDSGLATIHPRLLDLADLILGDTP
jgi:hypothetical protein